MNERPVEDFGRVADIYDATRSLPEAEMGAVLEVLASVIPRESPVADVGVGTGRYAKPLQDRGFRVVGLDISARMMAKAREKGLENLVFSDAHVVPFRDGVFGAALLVHVLHLVAGWRGVVSEAARVSDGKLISVIEDGGVRTMGEEYRDLKNRMGLAAGRFDDGEHGLRGVVSPDELIPVVDVGRVGDADAEILRLERRETSATWDVPDEAHKAIIGLLRAEHGGERPVSRRKLEVAVWSAPRLRSEFPATDQKG